MNQQKELLEKLANLHSKAVSGEIKVYDDIMVALSQARDMDCKEAIARSLSSLAWIDYFKGDLDQAIGRYDKAIDISEKEDFPKVLAAVYNNQALAYSRLGDRPKAISKFFKALELFSKLDIKKQQVNVLENIGCQYTDLGDLDKGEEYFLKAKEMNASIRETGAKGLNINMAMMYLKKENFDKALDLLKETLEDPNSTNQLLGFAYSVKAMVYNKKGNHKKALETVELSLKKAHENDLKSMTLRLECFKSILNAELGNYNQAKTEALNLLDKTNENANLINLYMALYKVYLNEKDFEQALNYYQLHEKCLKKVDGLKSKNHLASVEGKYQNILKEKEKEILRLQKIEMEQKAIRAQLNPHFFFNALNSINKFILDNDQQNASKFLQNFSGLMRKTLENSEEMFITLEDEIAFLKDYLSLEQLRFNNSFEFKIQVDDEIEEDFVKIPTMLLQPYIENAIKHGVNGVENGRITLDFKLDEEENLLCTVEDNGKGLKVNPSKSNHKSMATKLLKERLVALKEQFQLDFKIQTVNLAGIDKTTNGTRVQVLIPNIENR